MSINIPPFEPLDLPGLRRKYLLDQYGVNPDEDPFTSVRSVMGDPRASTGAAPTPSAQELIDQMGSFDTSKQDAFNDLLSRRPVRESPSIASRITAAGMSWGAKDPLKIQDEVMNKPYHDKLEDWKGQVDPSYKAAQ